MNGRRCVMPRRNREDPKRVLVVVPGQMAARAHMLSTDKHPWQDAASRAVRRMTGQRMLWAWSGWHLTSWADDGSTSTYRATFVRSLRDGGAVVVAEASADVDWSDRDD